VSGTEINVHGFEAYGGSTASVHNGADLQASGSAVIREGSTLVVDTTSRFTMGGDLRVNTGGKATIQNDIAPHNAFIENQGSLLDIANGSLNATLGSVIVNDRATYNHNVGLLSTSTSFEVRDFSTATLTDVNVGVGQNFTVTNGQTGGSTYRQTRGILNIGTNWDVYGGSGVTLTDVALTSGDFGLIHNSSSFVQSGGSITTGGRFQVDNSNASLTNVDLTTGAGAGVILSNGAIYTQSGGKISSGEILQVTGANTTADLTDVHLILSSDLQVLDGASYTQKNITSNSALNVGGMFRVNGDADVSLSSLAVGARGLSVEGVGTTIKMAGGSLTTQADGISISGGASYTQTNGSLVSGGRLEVSESGVSLTNTNLLVKDGGFITGSVNGPGGEPRSLTQTGGSFHFGDEMSFDNGAVVTLNGGAVLGHENTGNADSRGSLYVRDGGTLKLSGTSTSGTATRLDLTTGNDGHLLVQSGSRLEATDQASIAVKTWGNGGLGTTIVLDNATVDSGFFGLGDGASASVDNGTQMTVTTGEKRVDIRSGGTLDLHNGSTLATGGVLVLGSGSGLTVDSTASVSAENAIGLDDSASLVIQSGGVVTSEGADINGGATATVQGSDSSWTSQLVSGRGDFGVNDGKLDVLGGAKVEVSSGSTVIGRGVDASGEVLVSGPVSTFSNTGAQGDLIVGFEGGTGRLNVEEGGQVQSAYASIGLGAGSAGEAVVTGTGSKWTATAIGIGGGGATGTLTVTDSGLVDADDVFVYEDGTLNGSGSVDGTVHDMGGTVSPGNSPGTLNVGNFILQSGILEIQVGGLSSGDYDVLNVTGNAYLNGGTILFSFINGFLPDEGDYLPFLTAGGEITIDSNNVIYAYEGAGPGFLFAVESGTGGLIFRAENDATSGVPAPGTLWLLGVGIAAGLRCSRRRAA
jgi:T5SS/PEP-CTERM-associated repeat protein